MTYTPYRKHGILSQKMAQSEAKKKAEASKKKSRKFLEMENGERGQFWNIRLGPITQK